MKIFIVLVGLVCSIISVHYSKSKATFNVVELLPSDHPIRKQYNENLTIFPEIDQVLVQFQRKDFQKIKLDEIYQVGRKAEILGKRINGVRKISSLHNSEYIKFDRNHLQLIPFFREGMKTKDAKDALKDPFWKDKLVSKDKKAVLIAIELKKGLDEFKKREVVQELMAQFEGNFKEGPFVPLFLGKEVIKKHLHDEVLLGQKLILPLLYIILFSILYFLFRNLFVIGIFYLLLIISYSIVLMTIVWWGNGPNPYDTLSLYFVLIIVTSDLVHYLTQWQMGKDEDLKVQMQRVREKVFRPCLFTTITTVVAIGTLILNPLTPIRNFGIYCVLGSILGFVLTFYFLPFVILTFNLNLKKKDPDINQNTKMVKLIGRNSHKIIFSFGFVFLFFSWNSINLKIDDNLYDKFTGGHPFSQGLDSFKEKFGKVAGLKLIVDFKNQSIKGASEENKKQLRLLEKRLKNSMVVSEVDSLISLTDYLKSVFRNSGVNGERAKRLELATYRLFDDFGVMKHLIHPEKNLYQMELHLKDNSASSVEEVYQLVDKINEEGKYSITPHGFLNIRNYIQHSIVKSFLKSFLIGLFLIFICFLVFLKDLKLGLLALIPNIFPLLLITGMLGFFSLPMESNLVLLMCVTLGIAVDDTIHFLFSWKEFEYELNREIRIAKVFEKTNKALRGTTLIFIFCFSAFFLSNLKLFIQVGFFIMGSLIIALICDLILLPALLLRKEKFS